jgi:hypothetical protein
MLVEAAQTEIENLKHLAKLEAIEEETKKRFVVAKIDFVGPKIRWADSNKLF